MEQAVIEYLANALWQLPLLALGAWLLLQIGRPEPAMQHRAWLAVLALGLLLPLRGAFAPALQPTSVDALPMSQVAVSPAQLPQAPIAVLSPRANSVWPGLVDIFSAGLHRVRVSSAVAHWIVGLWLAVALWSLLRIALAWRAARRLVTNSREAAVGERKKAIVFDCARQVGVDAPELRESDAVAGPVVIGTMKPVLLWPKNLARTSEEQMRAAVFHELAHVRRRDYDMNLLCEIAALPLKWHPATHKVEGRIRATREMACDAIAAHAMDSETTYAECLVSLARRITGGDIAESAAVVGLFNGNVMEERVMRLMRGRTGMSLPSRVVRGAAGVTAMAATILLAGAFHVTPAMAQGEPVTPAMEQAQPATSASPQLTAVPQKSVPAAKSEHAKPHAYHEKSNDAKATVVVNGQERDLTPAERARIEKQLAKAQEKIAEATAKINSPEFRRKIEEAQRKALRAQTMLNSAEFQQKMADAQKQIAEATAKINSPEFQKKIQAEIDAAAKVNSEELQKQIGDAQGAALRAQTMLNSPEFKRQMADAQKQIVTATARLNSPEFRKQIQDAVDASMKVNSAEFQKQMAEAQKQLADAMARLKAEQEKNAAK